eukprot:PhF_6_TR43130/c0_g1_i4/m.65982
MTYVLQSMTISGFRSFSSTKPQTFSFAPHGITVIQGANGAGKSNIVEALSTGLGFTPPRDDIFHKHGSTIDDVVILEIVLQNTVTCHRHKVMTKIFIGGGEKKHAWNGVGVSTSQLHHNLLQCGISFHGKYPHFILHQHSVSTLITADGKELLTRISGALGVEHLTQLMKHVLKACSMVESTVTDLNAHAVLVTLKTKLSHACERKDKLQLNKATLSTKSADAAVQRTMLEEEKRNLENELVSMGNKVRSAKTTIAALESDMNAKVAHLSELEEDEALQVTSMSVMKHAVDMILSKVDMVEETKRLDLLLQSLITPVEEEAVNAGGGGDVVRHELKQLHQENELLHKNISHLSTQQLCLRNEIMYFGKLPCAHGTVFESIALKPGCSKYCHALDVIGGGTWGTYVCDTKQEALALLTLARQKKQVARVWPMDSLEVPDVVAPPNQEMMKKGCVRAV